MSGQAAACRRCGATLRVPNASANAKEDPTGAFTTSPPPVASPLPILQDGPNFAPPQPRNDGDAIPADAIVRYVEDGLGSIAGQFQDARPLACAVDVAHIRPSEARPFHTLVTLGMSRRPMPVPAGILAPAHVELMLALPAPWPVDDGIAGRPEDFWPVELLRGLARLPETANTWLGSGHLISNGNPPQPYCEAIPFSACVLLPPLEVPSGFARGFPAAGRRVDFLAVIPLYANESETAARKGLPTLLRRLDRAGVTERLNVARPSVARRRWW